MQQVSRILFSITTILLLMHGLLYNAILFIDYEINKTEITELFCINKDKPELNCNGSCHLMQQLKEREHKESQQINYQDFKIEAISEQEELCFDVLDLKVAIWPYNTDFHTLNETYLVPSPPPNSIV